MANGESTVKSTGKYKNWVFEVYPESAPDKWEQLITDLHIPWCHSPLHDQDINDDGSVKKPHYHCLIMFDGPTTFNNISTILKGIMGKGYVLPLKCLSVRGTVRYFCHLDDPDKAAYDPGKCFYYGCDINDLMKPTISEAQKYLREIQQFCIDNDILELCDLTDICMSANDDWFYLITTHFTYYLSNYLRSRRYKKDHPQGDPES